MLHIIHKRSIINQYMTRTTKFKWKERRRRRPLKRGQHKGKRDSSLPSYNDEKRTLWQDTWITHTLYLHTNTKPAKFITNFRQTGPIRKSSSSLCTSLNINQILIKINYRFLNNRKRKKLGRVTSLVTFWRRSNHDSGRTNLIGICSNLIDV